MRLVVLPQVKAADRPLSADETLNPRSPRPTNQSGGGSATRRSSRRASIPATNRVTLFRGGNQLLAQRVQVFDGMRTASHAPGQSSTGYAMPICPVGGQRLGLGLGRDSRRLSLLGFGPTWRWRERFVRETPLQLPVQVRAKPFTRPATMLIAAFGTSRFLEQVTERARPRQGLLPVSRPRSQEQSSALRSEVGSVGEDLKLRRASTNIASTRTRRVRVALLET